MYLCSIKSFDTCSKVLILQYYAILRVANTTKGLDDGEARRYAEVRPVDPFPHKKLAQVWLDSDTPDRAIPHLEHIDQHEQKSPVFALELAKLLRRSGQQAEALAKATRAAQISPYEPSIRMPAAEIATEAGRLDLARRHIVALTVLEPDHQRHRQRLEAIDRMIARGD